MEHQDIREGFTHGGVFHADDVFASALLKIINPNIKIYRGYKVPDGFCGIVYDIGGGRFDHHQKDKKIRENGIPYAAFGLLWEVYGKELLGEKESVRFDEKFVQPLDLADNTGSDNILSEIISDCNICWNEPEQNTDKVFQDTVEFAKVILQNHFKQIWAKQEAYSIVRKKAEQTTDQILYLEQAMPWKEAVKDLDILYVIYASKRGGYCIQAVPSEEEKNLLRQPFPEVWRGASAGELERLTGIKGFQFCHASGFICSVDTLEQARKVAKLALGRNER